MDDLTRKVEHVSRAKVRVAGERSVGRAKRRADLEKLISRATLVANDMLDRATDARHDKGWIKRSRGDARLWSRRGIINERIAVLRRQSVASSCQRVPRR